MAERVSLLMREFLGWVASRHRTYADVMQAWRSTCPRHTTWEDALTDGLVEIQVGDRLDDSAVILTPCGRAILEERQSSPSRFS